MNPLLALLGPLTDIIGKFVPDKARAAEIQFEIFKLTQNSDLALAQGQMDANKVEAANANLFVSGWRPAVGWCCVLTMAVNYLVVPLADYAAKFFDFPAVPRLDMTELWPVLMGMLGIGGMRTIEKLKGAA